MNYGADEAHQIGWSPYKAYGNAECRRDKVGGVWGEWEYENPPMFLGVEYRTTERHNGKVVYTKLVDTGMLVEGWNQFTYYDSPYARPIRWSGSLISSNPGSETLARSIPFGKPDENQFLTVKVTFGGFHVYLSSFFADGNQRAHVRIWYTKEALA